MTTLHLIITIPGASPELVPCAGPEAVTVAVADAERRGHLRARMLVLETNGGSVNTSAVAEYLSAMISPSPSNCVVQWWVADLDRYGNPRLTDGAHSEREGCEEAIYIMARLGIQPDRKRAICRVEIYPPEAKSHGANEDALKTLNSIGLGQNDRTETPPTSGVHKPEIL